MVMEGCREPSHLPSPRCVSAALETARNSGPDRARCKFAAGLAKPENRIRKEPRAGWQQGPREAKRGGAELECARPEMVTPRRYQPTGKRWSGYDPTRPPKFIARDGRRSRGDLCGGRHPWGHPQNRSLSIGAGVVRKFCGVLKGMGRRLLRGSTLHKLALRVSSTDGRSTPELL